jgi:hypothetical protein
MVIHTEETDTFPANVKWKAAGLTLPFCYILNHCRAEKIYLNARVLETRVVAPPSPFPVI